MTTAKKPTRLTLRAYPVGFGDCFLMTWHYGATKRHVLIDFGSTAKPEGMTGPLMQDIAKHIAKTCDGKLHAVVATHRHADHISGFTTNAHDNGPGDIIRGLKPDVVVQPWTEDPRVAADATKPSPHRQRAKALRAAMDSMHAVALRAEIEAKKLSRRGVTAGVRELAFLGRDNLKNLSAIENLESMVPAARHVYAYYGSRSGLETLLPGVTVRVLGPPTLEQSDAIRTMRSSDADEFWHLQAHNSALPDDTGALFPDAGVFDGTLPSETRWFCRRLNEVRADELLQIVRALDAQMNNTSLILLFEAGGKRFLFPGDAQYECWNYALSECDEHEANRKLLSTVDLYKVGHHGSLNATPKSLWHLFQKKSDDAKPGRLTTVMSTRHGKHGDAGRGTEVPRRPLVQELRRRSEHHTTETLRSVEPIVLEFKC